MTDARFDGAREVPSVTSDRSSPPEFTSGWYKDRCGRRWWCGQPDMQRGRNTIACNSEDGFMTAADPATFRAWGWKPEELSS